MRLINGGLLFLFTLVFYAGLFASPAHGQITGRVEVIGFDGKYRPGCWTPILVRLQSNGSPTDLYELRVWQYDQDGDRPYYSRRVNISADKGELPFWTYFIPEPVHEGLTSPSTVQQDLMQRLKITVHDKEGKELTQVSLANAAAQSVDPQIVADRQRANRFVVFVGAGAAPALRDYGNEIVGLQEGLEYSRVTPDRLPESSIGYEGVDAVVWLDGSPTELTTGSSSRLEALRDYVKLGGKLIISTQPQWQQLAGFDDLMPVTITGLEQNALQSPARDIANQMSFPRGTQGAPARNPWLNYRTPFSIAVGELKPGAVVDAYADRVDEPTKPEDRTPWLVRMPMGYGSVVWVAQDLGSRELSDRANWGWPMVWERVFGSAALPQSYPSATEKETYNPSGNVDLGFALIDGMNLSGRGAAMVSVTIAFFIVYWLVAGPGAFFFLKYRGKSTLNWFVFGAIALGATGVTMLVVRVMLRGNPEMKHVSLVRVHGDRTMPASVSSRMGIYVPQDGSRRIELARGDARFPSTLTNFPIHPTIHRRRNGDDYLFPAPREYRVNVPIGEEAAGAVIDLPFRTTMKRLRATWVGQIEPRIEGTPKLEPTLRGEGYISGVLRNLTGGELTNVYIAFRHQPEGVGPTYWMMHIPTWPDGTPLDLATAFNPPANKRLTDISVSNTDVRVGEFPVRGMMQDWIDRFRGVTTMGGSFDYLKPIEDFAGVRPESLPMLSFFNAFPVVRNAVGTTRADIHRSGARDWDISGALQAGELVIVARQENRALPMGTQIEGDPLAGSGTIVYQFVLPLTPLPIESTTQPTTQPK
jgi:hypothetical protein